MAATGSETVRVDQVIAAIPQVAALGIELVSMEAGRVVMALPYREDLIAYPETGVIAGGALFTLMDSAGGMAVWSAAGVLVPGPTLDLRLDYLKPATPGQTVYAHTHCYKATHHIGFVRGVACHDDPDDPIAHATATFMINRREARGEEEAG